MASPIAHSLAGAMIYFGTQRGQPLRRNERWTTIVAANIADLDLLIGLLVDGCGVVHRTASHSITMTLALALAAVLYLRGIGYARTGTLGMLIFLALCSQLFIDWISYDDSPPRGILLFWPFQSGYFMSEINVFLNVRRDNLMTWDVIGHNAKAMFLELALLGPAAFLLWRRFRLGPPARG